MEWVDAVGKSGGLISVWYHGLFYKDVVVKDRNFLLVVGKVKGLAKQVCVVNVYAPQDALAKRDLCLKLRDLKYLVDGYWIFIGDFNEVRFPEECLNSQFNATTAQRLNDFVNDLGLLEYNMSGYKYTFRAGNSDKLNKIDRPLVCPVF
ncbi:putative Endonuclease/exonuclease/phosphatase superfamily [Helianthus annuus]|uniref:Endonuclease/exonuclease/phosphatase superfamily n=1 Tax=Helianthus annuus TaxID=4232 RepID=A0A9K3JQI2_HELAN|nr:putative Endonuclease/exonuclease/phosphatase superfamily [Helianthus annuus]KAJ0605321.1 putative Endonuclease/exonuclease/phosphatase superfamily [Helianthus annuus]